MEEKFEKKLKAFVPYIIIIGLVFLVVPILMTFDKNSAGAFTYIVQIGILPLTTIICCAHFAMKHRKDFLLSLVAPLFYAITMFLYGMVRTSLVNSLIYLVAYFLCGYLGLMIGDILSNNKAPAKKAPRPAPQNGQPAARRPRPEQEEYTQRAERPARPAGYRPERVAVEKDYEPVTSFAEDPEDDASLDTSTTTDDIDAILKEIHQRRGSFND